MSDNVEELQKQYNDLSNKIDHIKKFLDSNSSSFPASARTDKENEYKKYYYKRRSVKSKLKKLGVEL